MNWSSEPPSGSKYPYELNLRHHQSSMQVWKQIIIYMSRHRLAHQAECQLDFVFQQLNQLDFDQRNGLLDRISHISHHSSELVSLHSSFIFVLVIMHYFSPLGQKCILWLLVVSLCFKFRSLLLEVSHRSLVGSCSFLADCVHILAAQCLLALNLTDHESSWHPVYTLLP